MTIDLEKHAASIPSLGYGGRCVAPQLRHYAAQVKPGHAIVELGPWLGSASAYLCLGRIDGGGVAEHHAFDLWESSAVNRSRLEEFHDLPATCAANLMEMYQKNIQPFGVPVTIHRESAWGPGRWSGGPIGLYIDDIGSCKEYTDGKFRKFAHAFVPGAVIFLMDFYFYESRSHREAIYKYQQKFMKHNRARFEYIERPYGSRCAIFKYLGGEIDYGVEE